MKYKIIAISGSLRKESYTLKLLKAFEKSAPAAADFEIIDISGLPLINEDLETELPKSVIDLRSAIQEADAILFATPEYNRSYSPVVKNAIDWGSRPSGQNSWYGKPAGVIGCTPFRLGAFGAVNHLRQVLMYINTPTMQQPEFYLEEIVNVLDKDGNINNPRTQKYIDDYWAAFMKWIERTAINDK
ncbi:chromate reductase [Mucilaginibacter sp. UYNi724]